MLRFDVEKIIRRRVKFLWLDSLIKGIIYFLKDDIYVVKSVVL